MMTLRRAWLLVGALGLAAASLTIGGCRPRGGAEAEATPATSVQVEPAQLRTMNATVSVTGTIKARDDVVLSSQSTGRVIKVAAREGDRVRRGQALITLDQSESQAMLDQAEASLAAARARLAQAITAAEVEPTQIDAQIRQAEAALSAARDRLAIVEKGAREQERRQAENAVVQAKANMDNAEADLKRMEYLLAQKAVAPQAVDAARTHYEVAKAAYNSAVEQRNLIQEGARPEEIQAAEAQVRQADEALRAARASRAQIELRRREVESARAGVAQARASVDYASSQHSQKIIRSPIDGDVYLRNVDPGEVVIGMSGSPLLSIADLDTLYYEAEVSETEIESISLKQPVVVTIDALKGKQFNGWVATVVPKAAMGSRNFVVKIRVENPSRTILPGMFARGQIAVEERPNAIVVDKDAVIVRQGRPTVFVVEGGKAEQRPVEVGLTNADWAEITYGVSPGDRVIVMGQQTLGDGDPVRVVDSDAGGQG
jgi:HlyD family secretion protein